MKMHIGPTRLLEDNATTDNYDSEGKLYGGSQGLDQSDNRKIEEAIVNVKDNKNKVEDL